MCVAPNRLADGTQVACHECWQCRNARVDDWVGRCIAESRTAAASHAITLTYGRGGEVGKTSYGEAEHERAVVLTYSDVQKYFKKLRANGYKLRYLVTGEYGARKGRAHWHIIVFWLGKVPQHKLDEKFAEPHWEHGHSFWAKPEYEHFRYNTKYILKDMGKAGAERQGHLAMSKKPPLGAKYFADLAWRYAEGGLAPQGSAEADHTDGNWNLGRFQYTFPEAVRRNGERVIFTLRDTSEQLFLDAYCKAWGYLHGDKPMPRSRLVEEFLDPGSWRRHDG